MKSDSWEQNKVTGNFAELSHLQPFPSNSMLLTGLHGGNWVPENTGQVTPYREPAQRHESTGKAETGTEAKLSYRPLLSGQTPPVQV